MTEPRPNRPDPGRDEFKQPNAPKLPPQPRPEADPARPEPLRVQYMTTDAQNSAAVGCMLAMMLAVVITGFGLAYFLVSWANYMFHG